MFKLLHPLWLFCFSFYCTVQLHVLRGSTSVYQQESSVVDSTVFVTDSSGMAVMLPIDMTFFSSSVEDAAEPSIGITSSDASSLSHLSNALM